MQQYNHNVNISLFLSVIIYILLVSNLNILNKQQNTWTSSLIINEFRENSTFHNYIIRPFNDNSIHPKYSKSTNNISDYPRNQNDDEEIYIKTMSV